MSLLSDYRYRGVSFSDRRPAAQVGVNYDDPSGWYAGLFASTVRFAAPPMRGAQTTVYLGYAKRTAAGVTFEVGADDAIYTLGRSYRYPEVYIGVAADNLSARLYYATRYFGSDSNTLYAELNGALLLTDRVRLLAHVGALRSPNSTAYTQTADFIVDGRVGVAIDVERFNVQLAWVGVSSSGAYPIVAAGHRNTAVVSVSRSF